MSTGANEANFKGCKKCVLACKWHWFWEIHPPPPPTESNPPNPEGFRVSERTGSIITLQWNKVNNNVSFVLLFDGTETNISAPVGDGPVSHIISSPSAGTNYTFTLHSVFENIRSSGVSIIAYSGKILTSGINTLHCLQLLVKAATYCYPPE